MDSVFFLSPEARGRFLRYAARISGCIYISLWSYQPQLSNCLISTDGWFHEDETGQQPSSSSGMNIARRLFDAYRRLLCSVESGCVPGWAYKARLPYLELRDTNLMNSATTQIQRQFYQEAGIKTALFMGCKSGEIEIGMSASSSTNRNVQMEIEELFTEDFIQQSQLGDLFLPDQSRPSSSSSSLRSLSVGSPEYSSLFLSKPSSSLLPADTLKELGAPEQAAAAPTMMAAPALPHQMAMPAYSRFPNVQFPTPESDDAAMTRAMLAVLSAASASSLQYLQPPQPVHTHQAPIHRPVGAFKQYKAALAPRHETKPSWPCQKMIKTAISIYRRIGSMRTEAQAQETRLTTNQLHHVISERKRREKINESFHALRALLPPGSKKDKASVLASTKEYMDTLKVQINDLEEKNRILEMHNLPGDDTQEEPGDSSQRLNVQIVKANESSSEMQQISLRISVKVECDIIELVIRVLECLKEVSQSVSLVSVDARTGSPASNLSAIALLALQVKANDWDEAAFKEAVTKAVDGAVAQPQTATSP